MVDDQEGLRLHTVSLMLCRSCLRGDGGECHSPGCALFLNRAPDIPISHVLSCEPPPPPQVLVATDDGFRRWEAHARDMNESEKTE